MAAELKTHDDRGEEEEERKRKHSTGCCEKGGGGGGGVACRGAVCRAGPDVDLALLDLAAGLRGEVEHDVPQLLLQLPDGAVLTLACRETPYVSRLLKGQDAPEGSSHIQDIHVTIKTELHLYGI
ncbi:hypothetical protein EYF80_035342 [Liparis tanakae]|uniref:Uncharacterized protein n=1 Tax=Liparis tanakae TaxID=230148 RepID=A0A4Z2GNP6_9TELE|nr:hypothetical protein EYF80_035342 [Liparis tanakae]